MGSPASASVQDVTVDGRGAGWHPRGGQGAGSGVGTKGDSGRQEAPHPSTCLAFKPDRTAKGPRSGNWGFGGPEPKLSGSGSQSIFFKITTDLVHTHWGHPKHIKV